MSHTPKHFPLQLRDGFCVVVVDGEIDVAVADLMAAELAAAIEAGPPRLLVDLSQVTFMDSSALSALVGTHKKAVAVGGEVRLVGPNARLRKLLAITQLDQLFPVHDSVESACADAGNPCADTAATQKLPRGAHA